MNIYDATWFLRVRESGSSLAERFWLGDSPEVTAKLSEGLTGAGWAASERALRAVGRRLQSLPTWASPWGRHSVAATPELPSHRSHMFL